MDDQQLSKLLGEFDKSELGLGFLDQHPELLSEETDHQLIEWTVKRPGTAAMVEQLRNLFRAYRREHGLSIPSDTAALDSITASVKRFLESDRDGIAALLKTVPELLTDAAELRIALLFRMLPEEQQARIAPRWRLLHRCREIGIDAAITEASVASGNDTRDELRNLLAELQQPVSPTGIGARLTKLRRALELIDSRDQGLRAQILLTLGGLLMDDRQMPAEAQEEAIAAFQNALEALDNGSRGEAWAKAQMYLGTAYLTRIGGDRAENLELAIDAFQQVVNSSDRETQPARWAQAVNYLGSAHVDRVRGIRGENIERALEYYREALKIRSRAQYPVEWLETQHNLAMAYDRRVQGDRTENLEHAIANNLRCLRFLPRAPKSAVHGLLPAVLSNLANNYAERNRGDRSRNRERSIAYARRALRSIGDSDRVGFATVISGLAMTLAEPPEEQNVKEAINYCRRALKVFRRETMPVEWAETMHQMATIMFKGSARRRDSVERAIRAETSALEIITRSSLPETWAGILNNLGLMNAALRGGSNADRMSQAVQSFTAALEVRTLDTLPFEHLQTQSSLGDLFFKEGRWQESAGAYRAALRAHELMLRLAPTPAGRISALKQIQEVPDRLSFACARLGLLEEAVVVAEFGRARDLADALRLDRAPLDRLSPDHRSAFEAIRNRIVDLQADLRSTGDSPARFVKLSQELAAKLADLERVAVEIRSYFPAFLAAPALAQIRATCGIVPAVYLIFTEAGGVALVVRPAGIQVVWLAGADAQTLHTKALGYLRKYAVFRANEASESDKATWLDTLDQVTGWLWSTIMGRLLEVLADSNEAVFVTTGWIAMLPMHAAWKIDPSTPTGRLYVADRLLLHQAPSLQVYSPRDPHAAAPLRLVAIDEPQPVSAGPLSWSAAEVQSARMRFPEAYVLRGKEATLASAVEALPDAQVLHISCHAFADPDDALSSGLILAFDQVLSVAELFKMRLSNVRLAVLSACETGLSGTTVPSEAIGLPTGFLQAGVGAVAAALWAVSGAATSMLMARFYELWDPANTDPAAALRLSQQWVRDTTNAEKAKHFQDHMSTPVERGIPRAVARNLYRSVVLLPPGRRDHEHPVHWAPFAFFGT